MLIVNLATSILHAASDIMPADIQELGQATLELEDSTQKIIHSLGNTKKLISMDASNKDSMHYQVAAANKCFEDNDYVVSETGSAILNLLWRSPVPSFTTEKQETLRTIKSGVSAAIEALNKNLKAIGLYPIKPDQPELLFLDNQIECNKKSFDTIIAKLAQLKNKFDWYLRQQEIADPAQKMESSDCTLLKELSTFFAVTQSRLAIQQYELTLREATLKPVLDILKQIRNTYVIIKGLIQQEVTDELGRIKLLGQLRTHLSELKKTANTLQNDKKYNDIITELGSIRSEQIHILRNLNTLFAILNGGYFHVPIQEKFEKDIEEYKKILESNLQGYALNKIMSFFQNVIQDKDANNDISVEAPGLIENLKAIVPSTMLALINFGAKRMLGIGLDDLSNLNTLLRKLYPEQYWLAERCKPGSQFCHTTFANKESNEKLAKWRRSIDKKCPDMPCHVFAYFTQDAGVDAINATRLDDYYTSFASNSRNQEILLYDIACCTRFHTGRMRPVLSWVVNKIKEETKEETDNAKYDNKFDEIMDMLKDPSTPLSSPWTLFHFPPCLVRTVESMVAFENKDNESYAKGFKTIQKKYANEPSCKSILNIIKKIDDPSDQQPHEDPEDKQSPSGILGYAWSKVVQLKTSVVNTTGKLLNLSGRVINRVLGKTVINFVKQKINSYGSWFYSKVRNQLNTICLAAMRKFAEEKIRKIEQSLQEGNIPSVKLKKIQSKISDYELKVFEGPVGALLKRQHGTIQSMATQYHDVYKLVPDIQQNDPEYAIQDKKHDWEKQTFKDKHFRTTIAQISRPWAQIKKDEKDFTQKKLAARAQPTKDWTLPVHTKVLSEKINTHQAPQQPVQQEDFKRENFGKFEESKTKLATLLAKTTPHEKETSHASVLSAGLTPMQQAIIRSCNAGA